MSVYPPKIAARLKNPVYAGKLENADASGAAAAFICGAALKFFVSIDAGSGRITALCFLSSGCGFAIAAADYLAEKFDAAELKTLEGLRRETLINEIISNLDIKNDNKNSNKNDIKDDIKEKERLHCSELAVDALQTAFAGLRQKRIAEFSGEKALVCTCFGVSEETLENIIADHGITDSDQAANYTNAGSGCGSCRFLIDELIDSAVREKYARR